MNNHDYTIRLERREDHRETEALVREAFWNVYRPGCLEHYVLNQLRDDPAFVPELDLVLEHKGRLIGQIMATGAVIQADDGREIPILTMGPLAIHPDFQRQGLGKALLDHALEQAASMGVGAICFEGNIGVYSKCGFTYASTFGLRYHGLPEGEEATFFLGKELIPGYLAGITGEYGPPQGYFVDEAAAEEFDKGFTPKEKLVLPSQIF